MTDPDEMFVDPRFPNRPQHPNFWAMVEAVNYLDGQAGEGGVPPPEIVRQFVDPESLLYLANQRVLRGAEVRPELLTDIDLRAMCMALWVDAFALGCCYTEGKT
jgi:hypothetical protein